MVETERLNILSTLAASSTVFHMTDGHITRKSCNLCLIKHLCNKTFTSYAVKIIIIADSNDTTALLTSMLKSMETVICKTSRIRHAIHA